MLINSQAISLLLAATISIVTTAFLSLVPSVDYYALIIAFILSFSSSYILIRIVLEFLFFRQIKDIYEALEKISNPELSSYLNRKGKGRTHYLNPLRRINKEIFQYAEKKQQEISELRKMETFRREFIADVSHELKTPIFAAQGFVHTLLDGAIDDKKVRTKFLTKAARSLDGLDMLVQDLLTLSQMESGDIKMHFEHLDMIELCQDAFDQLESKAEKRKISVKIQHKKGEQIYVYADYHRIYQVMINLLSNAIKYTKPGGKVSVKFEVDRHYVTTYVHDNGQGIPEKDIGRIFERFYRVEKSRSKEKGGTGLGLAIAKHIMEAHHSSIQVESEWKVGSTFSFRLRKGNPPEEHGMIMEEIEEEE